MSIVVCDTETDGLHRDRLPWEVALIVPRDGQVAARRWRTIHLFIDSLDPVTSDPVALKIGRWHERYPHDAPVVQPGDTPPLGEGEVVHAEVAAKIIQAVTRDAWIVGANPAFDMGAMQNLMALVGLEPSWRYRPVCVENYVAAQQRPPIMPRGLAKTAELVGIDPTPYEAHTAVGDARLTLSVAALCGLLDAWKE